MDTSYEDKMYKQIEKSLSNNLNDRLFVPIEMIDENTYKGQKKNQVVDSVSYEESFDHKKPLYNDNTASYQHNDEGGRMSRAEYILHAREACLRQINTFDSSTRISDVNIGEEESVTYPHSRKKEIQFQACLIMKMRRIIFRRKRKLLLLDP